MKKIKNITLKKELKIINNYLYIFIIFIALSALFIALGIYENRTSTNNYLYLNDIIENKNNEENAYAYLEISQAPYSIAKYENEENYAFYIVFDGRYFYITYLSDDLYNKLNVEGLEENPLTIYGTTEAIPENVKEIALEVYNEGLDEENQITMDEFGSYFGEVFLNNTSLKNTNYIFYIISAILLLVSLFFLSLFIINKLKVRKTLKNMNELELTKLEKEIDDDKTLHYPKYHLILTNNYVIKFSKGLMILKYKDLIWVYEQKTKEYGITTSRKVFVMNKLEKTYNILTTDGLTKRNENIPKEVITAISNKNENILVGMNKKNEEKINEILKNS